MTLSRYFTRSAGFVNVMWRSYLACVPTMFLPSINCDRVQCKIVKSIPPAAFSV